MELVDETPALPNAPQADTFARTLVAALAGVFRRVGYRVNRMLPKDGSEAMTAPLPLRTYTVATLPASATTGAIVFVSDGAAGQKFRGWDGSAWANLG